MNVRMEKSHIYRKIGFVKRSCCCFLSVFLKFVYHKLSIGPPTTALNAIESLSGLLSLPTTQGVPKMCLIMYDCHQIVAKVPIIGQNMSNELA